MRHTNLHVSCLTSLVSLHVSRDALVTSGRVFGRETVDVSLHHTPHVALKLQPLHTSPISSSVTPLPHRAITLLQVATKILDRIDTTGIIRQRLYRSRAVRLQSYQRSSLKTRFTGKIAQ
jgi:hypothetical protein